MLDDYDSTLPYRLGFAAVFFVVMGVADWIKHPENPTRACEYLFLLLAMCTWVTYGIVHDHITASISPEYFLHAKGLASSPRPYRIAVTALAVKATYGPGALAGALLLIANNPSSKASQLRYPELFRICLVGLVLAATMALTMGLVSSFIGSHTVLNDLVLANQAEDRPLQFMFVWGVHAGSYLGAFLGSVLGIVLVILRRGKK